MPVLRVVTAVALFSLWLTVPHAQDSTVPDDAATEAFLRKAKVVSTRPITKGVTGALRATLTDGTLTHDAQIQTVDQFKQVFRTRNNEERNFRDSWQFNVAAYRIDRLIGLNLVPVSVERRWGLTTGAFTWWVDDVMMDEEERRKSNTRPPDPARWDTQLRAIRVFDQLIDNVDRNQGNLLITRNWRLWAIDHTRAFRYSRTPRQPEHVTALDPLVLERLEALDFPLLKREVGRYLRDDDIRNLLARRDVIIRLLAAGVFSEAPAGPPRSKPEEPAGSSRSLPR